MLAVDTTEALRVVRHGDWVVKHLRPHDTFDGESAADRLRQIRLRVNESQIHAELNPIWFDEAANCLVSRFIDGPWASTRQSNALLRQMIARGYGYLLDLAPQNLRMTATGPVAIDFAIDETHPDWLACIAFRSAKERPNSAQCQRSATQDFPRSFANRKATLARPSTVPPFRCS